MTDVIEAPSQIENKSQVWRQTALYHHALKGRWRQPQRALAGLARLRGSPV